MTQTIAILFYTWIITFLLQAISVPVLTKLLHRRLLDAGWGIGRLIGWLAIALPVWYLAHIGIPINTPAGIWIITLSLLAGSGIFFYQNHQPIIRTLKKIYPLILIQETLFFSGFMFLGIVRSYKPDILDLEKFMDAGFTATYLRASTLPAPDMWLAGETINYYSFGQFLGAVMTRIWGIELAISYNTLLATVMGLSLILSFSLVTNLLHSMFPKITYSKLALAGLFAALSTSVAGNTHAIWYRLTNGNFEGYWYPNATRFIENTIHEFPSYSFIVSDLHAHVWGFPFIFTQILLVFMWYQAVTAKEKVNNIYLLALAAGIHLGVILTTNAWDFAIYGLFTAITGLILFILNWHRIWQLVASAVIMLVSTFIVSSPWWLNFESISEGVELVTERSPLWQLAVLWTGHITLSVIAVAVALLIISKTKLKSRAKLFFILGMAATAWILLILPELIYVKDIYSGHPRANTMFKLTYQAFILMSLLGGWSIGAIWSSIEKNLPIKIILSSILILVLSATIIYPYFGYKGYYGFQAHQGLDGLQWLKNQHPHDYDAIIWLNKNITGQPVIVEAVGESYTTHNRVSAFTGLPTVLGWRVHQWLWRGGFDIPSQRTEEVKLIYEQSTSSQAQTLLNTYNVEYIIIGDKERETYTFNEDDLMTLGTPIFQSGTTTILKRN